MHREALTQRARALPWLVLVACGGSTAPDDAGAGYDAPGPTFDASSICAPDGVRICAPPLGCPALSSSECPGAACRGVGLSDGGDSGDGVCWSDLRDLGDVSCAACDDGQSCIRRGSLLVCVPDDVCRAFWQLGVRDVCTYADKHAFDDRPLPPEPSSCPGGLDGKGYLCGGACGPCRSNEAKRCVGRSPDHPVGVCAWLPTIADPGDPANIPVCKMIGGSYAIACPTAPAGLACGVFAGGSEADVQTARAYGLCMDPDMCKTIRSALPGGYDCYDSYGVALPP